MNSVYASKTFQQPQIQTSTYEVSSWPDLQIDDCLHLTADDLDVELLKDFFGSSLGEDIVKFARDDDTPSPPEPSTSTPSLSSIISPPSPTHSSSPSMPSTAPSLPSTASSPSPVPSSWTSMPSTTPSPSSSTTVPPSLSSRKRNATQDRSCVNCKTQESSMWRRDPKGNSLCNACGQHFTKFKVHRPAEKFNRPIKRRCRKVKQNEIKAASSTLLPPMNNVNFGMPPQHHFQQQPHQIPPAYAYYQPAPMSLPQFPIHQPPPPNAYFPYGQPSNSMMPFFQQSQ